VFLFNISWAPTSAGGSILHHNHRKQTTKMFSKLFNLSAFAALAAAATVSVDVSSSSGALTFSPNSVTANMGDTVLFTWQAGGHTVAQGQQSSACQPQSSGFYSGTQAPPTTFSINVSSTDPIWYYCSTPGHCQAGMVGVINPPYVLPSQLLLTEANEST
jgi:plastocyanin